MVLARINVPHGFKLDNTNSDARYAQCSFLWGTVIRQINAIVVPSAGI